MDRHLYGDAVIDPDVFDAVLEGDEFHFGLFGAAVNR